MSKLNLDLSSELETSDSHSASKWVIENSRTTKKISSLTFEFNMKRVYSKEYLRTILNYKLCYLRRLSVLALLGCNASTLENLIYVLHDLNIDPHRLFLNGKEMQKC